MVLSMMYGLKNGDSIVCDEKYFKKEFNWYKPDDYEHPKGYKRQLEMYQWFFKKWFFSFKQSLSSLLQWVKRRTYV